MNTVPETPIEVREEVRQLEESIKTLDDVVVDVQGIATDVDVSFEDEKRPRLNLIYNISEIRKTFSVLKCNLYPRIKLNPNFKKVEEILEQKSYRGSGWDDSTVIVNTNLGYCKKSLLIEISTNVYTVISYAKLLLEKVKIAEAKSSEVSYSLIENVAKTLIASEQGLVAYEKYKEPLSGALKEMWRLHGRTDQWQNIAPTWEEMNKQLDLIGADKLYKFSITHYEMFEEKCDDTYTFENDKRSFAILRGVLNRIDRFVRGCEAEL